MTTGQRIYSRRKELGISVEEIAEKVRVSPSTIFRYESGDIVKIPVSTLYSIADVLNVSPDFLLSGHKQQRTSCPANDAYIMNQLCLRPELRELMDLAMKADKREVRKIIRMIELMREK